MYIYNYTSHSLSVRVAGSNELEVSGHWSAINSTVTHDFLDEPYAVSGVGLIKKHHSAQFRVSFFVNLSYSLCIHHKLGDVFVTYSTMYLQ